jgi:hypothetical protein
MKVEKARMKVEKARMKVEKAASNFDINTEFANFT